MIIYINVFSSVNLFFIYRAIKHQSLHYLYQCVFGTGGKVYIIRSVWFVISVLTGFQAKELKFSRYTETRFQMSYREGEGHVKTRLRVNNDFSLFRI